MLDAIGVRFCWRTATVWSARTGSLAGIRFQYPEAMSKRRGLLMPDGQAFTDDQLMDRAVALAMRARGNTAPNPVVGCIIARDGVILGEGWHEGPGKPHAEPAAIADAKARGADIAGASAFVTLEPCNHTGRTGPCTAALIEAGLARVVYAVEDPNPLAAGGAQTLAASGVRVEKGLGEAAARHINRAWLAVQTLGRPYVIGKSAMTLDGRIATQTGESQWITAAAARAAGHALRLEADAIIVGAQTVIDDDPALTARVKGETVHAPVRVILDSVGRTVPGAKVYERHDDGSPGALLLATDRISSARTHEFERLGVEVLRVAADRSGRPEPEAALAALHERGMVCVLIEGGGTVLGSFFDADLIDEFHLFQAPLLFGGGKPGLAGDGVQRLADGRRFDFAAPEPCGQDMHWTGLRRREIA